VKAAHRDEYTLSLAMGIYWTRIAFSGDPNNPGDAHFLSHGEAGPVRWPPYTQAHDQHMQFQTPLSIGTGLHNETCNFWDVLASLA